LTKRCGYYTIRSEVAAERTERVRGDGVTVHNRLSVLRAERGWSRQRLADALSIHPQTIGYIERGDYNPSLELALRIGELFKLPIEAVFSLRPFKPLSEEVYGRTPQEELR
jgi:putative transcriptional regulator